MDQCLRMLGVWIEFCGEICLRFEYGGGDGSIWGFLKGTWYFGKVVMGVMGVRYGKESLNGVEDKVRSEGKNRNFHKIKTKVDHRYRADVATSGPRYWVPQSYPISSPKIPFHVKALPTSTFIIFTDTTHDHEAHITHNSTKHMPKKRLGRIYAKAKKNN